MPIGLKRVLMAAAVALLALAAPAATMAGGVAKCKASACLVYHEETAPNAGRKHPQRQHPTGSTSKHGKGGKTQHHPDKVARVLAAVGNEKGPLSRLLNDSGLGTVSAGAGSVAAPTALGAAFDLGSGPTALLAILAASVLGLGIYSGVRGWRQRRANA